MNDSTEHSIVRNARTFASLTLVSRVLGLVRDASLARLFGVTALGTAWGIAFQFPNTFRRLFGEGALSAAFIPEYTRLLRDDPPLAHRFASLVVALMAGALGVLAFLLVLVIVIVVATVELPDHGRGALVMLALMLPFMPLVCVTAVLGGMLQVHGRFAAQAGAPTLLNLCIIVAAFVGTRGLDWPAERTALLAAASVSIAGVLQTAWCLRDLRGLAAWSRAFAGAGAATRRMFGRMGPVIIGLGAMQAATLIESWVILAWPIYSGPTILGRAYPLDEGAGAALSNAQRLYQFPLGIFGIALATAAFPALARLADDGERFAATLRRSIRLAGFIGIPSTAGLAWVAGDLTAVIYRGGAVTDADSDRIARSLVMYAPLVGAYSITHVLTRALYARDDTRTPMRIGVLTVGIGLCLGLGMMWAMHEPGLALGSSIAAVMQLVMLALVSQARLGDGRSGLFDRTTLGGLGRIMAATAGMLAGLAALRLAWPNEEGATNLGRATRLGADCLAGVAVYAGLARGLCREEFGWLLTGRRGGSSAGSTPVGPI